MHALHWKSREVTLVLNGSVEEKMDGVAKEEDTEVAQRMIEGVTEERMTKEQ